MQKINFFIGELNPTDNFYFDKIYDMPNTSPNTSYGLFDGEWEVKLK